MELARPGAQTSLLAAAALVAAAAGAATAVARSPFLVAAALLAVAFVVLAARNLVAALGVFIAFTFVEQLPGAGSGVTAVKGMGAVVVVAWLVGLVRGRWTLGPLGDARPVLVGAVGIAALSVVSAAWAADPGTAVSSGLRIGQGVVLAIVLVSCLGRAGAAGLRAALAGFVAGAVASAIVGLLGLGAASTTITARVGGGLGDPNYLAAVLVPGMVFALALRPWVAERAARLLLLAAFVLMAMTLLRTESRGGVVALAASVLAAVVVGGRLRRQVVGGALAIALGAAIYLGAFAPASARRVVTFGSSGSGRTELWTIAYEVFRSHPLVGVGAGNFPVVEPAYAVTTRADLSKPYQEVTLQEVVHNTYLHVLAELGVVGLVLLALVVLGALALGRRAVARFRRAGDAELEELTRGLLVGAVGMFVAFAFLPAQYEKQLWIVVGLLAAAGALARSRPVRERVERRGGSPDRAPAPAPLVPAEAGPPA